MRLAITGGGTGGHVYPALEVGLKAQAGGDELLYFGSIRGQERAACERAEVRFQGFRAEPLTGFRRPAGWRALLVNLLSVRAAKAALRASGVDVVFSTGGYGAAPVVAAARSLGIPYVVHEANSVPGRVNRLFAKRAARLTYVFRHTAGHFSGLPAERTGQPIRSALREAAGDRRPNAARVMVTGGSQGSLFLNQNVPLAAEMLRGRAAFLHATGRAHLDSVHQTVRDRRLEGYDARAFLEADAMAEGYATSSLVVGRSGGSCAEYACFRLPSILVPLPNSADDHQHHNAKEFAEMNAATLLPQSEALPSALASAIAAWLDDPARVTAAEQALADWDIPDATERIVRLVREAAG